MVVFKMRESVPIARYSPVCNVLRQWKTSLILTYRVYRLYDIFVSYDVFVPAWAPVTRNAQTSDRPVEVQWSILVEMQALWGEP